MNKNALIISLRNLNDAQDQLGDIESVRKYISLYLEIRNYIYKYKAEADILRAVSDKLPILEYKEYKSPFYMAYDFMCNKMRFGKWGSGVTLNEFCNNSIDTYPERTKYILEIEARAREIRVLLNELMSELQKDTE